MMDLQLGSRLGPYEIVSLLGAGGMGVVYRARDSRLGRDVALKIMHEAAMSNAASRDRLLHEARILSTLNHPHIRAIFDAAEFDGVTTIVMEYVEGETLDHRLGRRPLPLALALEYGAQLAGALDVAHHAGVIHRDIKPANVMVTGRGVKLLDFGVATLRRTLTRPSDVRDASTLTEGSSVPGTTAYMAPEQLDGSDEDPRSDIFSLGAVLYQMLTGRKPFDAPTRARTIAAILEHDPPPLSSDAHPVPEAVERVIVRCLAKEPDERWQTAKDLASELAWLARAPADQAVAARPRASVLWTVAPTVAIVAAVIIGYAMLRPSPSVASAPTPVRFLMTGPANSVVTVNAGAFSVSPDGRHLAFTASSGSGPRLLWIRSFDAFEATPLSGTDDAQFPFWSPDSRTIAFFATDRLKTIDISGSPLQIVADIPANAQWGAWSQHGDIAFTNGRSLFRLRASGGLPQPVISSDETPGQPSMLGYGGIEFLPDGAHHLLSVIEPGKPIDQVGIYVGTFEAPLERLLVRADSQATYAEPGYLLYMLAGTLIAHPFNANTREFSGEPVPVPDPVAFVRAQRRAAFSVSQNGVLVYRQGVATSQLTWFDRSGRRVGVIGAPGRYINPALSPDGTRVAVTRLSPSIPESTIWLFEPWGERPFTATPTLVDAAVWSPDGTRLAYSWFQGGISNLFVKDAAASAEEAGQKVLANTAQKFPMDWTRDGRFLVFAESSALEPQRAASVVAMSHEGAPEEWTRAQSPPIHGEEQMQVSPDGQWMAYVSYASGSPQVYVRRFPNGQRRWQVSTDGGFEPKWRGDGREMFYIAPDQQMMSVDVRSADESFQVQRPRPLFRAPVIGAPLQNGFVRNEYAVTRDGQRFLVNEPVGGAAGYPIRVLVNWRSLLPSGPQAASR